MSEIDTTRAMAKRAASILMQHYHGQLNNPIVMAKMLLLEGVFNEQDCREVTRETAISGQSDAKLWEKQLMIMTSS